MSRMVSLKVGFILGCFYSVVVAIPRPVPHHSQRDLQLLNDTHKHIVKRAALKTKWVTHSGQIKSWGDGNSIQVDATTSVSDYAHHLAATIIAHMTTHMSGANFAKAASRTKIGVFAATERLTVYPEYYYYAAYQCSEHQCSGSCSNTCTFDGRQYYTLAGAGGARAVVSEKNLMCQDDYQGKSNILVHEYSHSIHGNVLDSQLRSRITAAYTNARNNNIWSDNYAMSNAEEYFAVGASVYFHTEEATGGGSHSMNQCGNQVCSSEAATRYHLYQRDQLLYGILYDVFSDQTGNLKACMAH